VRRGSDPHSIADSLVDEIAPAWSPDGARLAFVRSCTEPELCTHYELLRRDGAGELYVVGARGGTVRRL